MLLNFLLSLTAWLSRKLLLLKSRGTDPAHAASNRVQHFEGAAYSEAIVVTTFSSRFVEFCIPLVQNLRKGGVNQPIYIVVNADWTGEFDNLARARFVEQTTKIANTFPVCLGQPVGMAQMWNLGIRASGADLVVVLNDDTLVDPQTIEPVINSIFVESSERGLAIVNRSFGHFGISKKCLLNLGEFDERFLGFGYEDGDYYWRYESTYGESPAHLDNVVGIFNVSDQSGHEFDSENSRVRKYSIFNRAFLELKFEFGSGSVRGMFGNFAARVLDEPTTEEKLEWEMLHKKLVVESDYEKIKGLLQVHLDQKRIKLT